MAKFRQNHSDKGHARFDKNSKRSMPIWRVGLFAIAFFAMLYFLSKSLVGVGTEQINIDDKINEDLESERFYVPTYSGQLIHHKYYSLSYIEKHEQAEWVAYVLTKESLRKPNVPRAKKFKADYDVKTRSAFHRDYTHSGYTRGHLAPAGDMAFNQEAMQESFFMSNMSPQLRSFNNGVWRELEEQTRDWAYEERRLFVVSGPILSEIQGKIGENKVSIPKKFFKVLLDIDGNRKNGIGFIIENRETEKHLHEFAVTIDEVEKLTGINFYGSLISEELEEELESDFDLKHWPVKDKRFKSRVKHWNRQ